MLVSDIKTPLTVESLIEIVGSQLALYENQQLIIRPKKLFSTGIELIVNNDVIVWGTNDEEMIAYEVNLNSLLSKLDKLNPDHIVQYSSTLKIPFRIGFIMPDEGFIEVLNSQEIKRTLITP